MSKSKKDKAWKRLVITEEMLCTKEFSPYYCGKCKYYYRESGYQIGRCLKQNIRDWTLYHMEKGE